MSAVALAPTSLDALPVSARKFRLSQHVLERAELRGFSAVEVLAAAADPQIVLPSPRGDASMWHLRGDCRVVVASDGYTILTVHEATDEESAPIRQARAREWASAKQRPVPPVPAAAEPAAVTPEQELIHQKVTEFMAMLESNPGRWAILTCTIPGLPTALAAHPNVELVFDRRSDKTRVRWVDAPA